MKSQKVICLLFVLMVFACNPSYSQEPQRVRIASPPSGGYRMLSENGSTSLPFDFIANHVVIPAYVEGKKLNLILDTGMPADGLLLFGSEKVNALGLSFVGKASVMGAGGQAVESDLAMGVAFGLPGMEFTDQMVIVMPKDSDLSSHFEGKDGVIGHTLFSRFVVYIDHDNMRVTISEPDRFEYAGSGHEFPLRIGRFPFLACEARIAGGEKVLLDLVVDTGNGAALTLNVGAQEGLVLPEKVIEYQARSVGKVFSRLAGRIAHLQLGPFAFENLLCSFRTSSHEPTRPLEKEGALGQGILRRFNTVIDYTGERIILEPNGYFDEPFEFNMAGIQFKRSGNGFFVIDRVIPDSPASEAGLLAGDLITQINGSLVDRLSADDVEETLKMEGQETTLDIRREDESLKARLKLRRLI